MIAVMLYILYALGIILLLVLIVPIGFCFRGGYAQDLSMKGRIAWAGGLFSLEVMHNQGNSSISLGVLGLRKAISAGKGPKKSADKTDTRKKRSKPAARLSAFINRQLLSAVKTVLHRLRRAMHLELHLSGVYGCDDPAYTGFAAALIAALLWSSNTISLYPDFTREITDIEGYIRGWLIPLQVIIVILLFLLAKPVRFIWWPMIKRRKKHKEAVQYA